MLVVFVITLQGGALSNPFGPFPPLPFLPLPSTWVWSCTYLANLKPPSADNS